MGGRCLLGAGTFDGRNCVVSRVPVRQAVVVISRSLSYRLKVRDDMTQLLTTTTDITFDEYEQHRVGVGLSTLKSLMDPNDYQMLAALGSQPLADWEADSRVPPPRVEQPPDDEALDAFAAYELDLWERPVTTWDLVDINPILAGDTEEEPPVILKRSDGVALLYAGKVHDIHGEPESCKGWLACLAVKDCLESTDRDVMYVDFEDTPKGVVSRLMNLGIDTDVLANRFHYVGPTEPLYDDPPGVVASALKLRSTRKSLERTFMKFAGVLGLVVLDGMTQAIANQSGNSNSNDDIAVFFRDIPRWIIKENPKAAVLIVDHVTKDAQNTRFAIGGQMKLGAIDGASYFAKVKTPFGRGGRDALVEILVSKDRPGCVREFALYSGNILERIADFHLHSYTDSRVIQLELTEPDRSIGRSLKAIYDLKVKLYEAIEAQPGMNTREVREAGKGHDKALITLALDQMETEGNITVTGKNPKRHLAVTPPVATVADLL